MATVNLNRTEVIRAAHRKAIPLVTKVSRQTLAGAKRLAPRGDHLHGSGKAVRGATLVQSLHETPLKVTSSTVSRRVGTRKNYAATAHQGSKPHVIASKGKLLKFQWERGNLLLQHRGRKARRFFFALKVNHPGNRHPRRYLTTPMVQYGRAAGFRTISSPLGRSGLFIMMGHDY